MQNQFLIFGSAFGLNMTGINIEEFQQFTGQFDNCDLQMNYIDTAKQVVNSYLGYDIDNEYLVEEEIEDVDNGSISLSYHLEVPPLIKQTVYRIASLLQIEEKSNIGINSKSFGESGSRSYLNITNYDSYLKPLSEFKLRYALRNVEIV